MRIPGEASTTEGKRVPLPCGAHLWVPDDLRLMTPYVLEEQGDWFEDDIRFVRAALEPGENVIDVGANYGVYTATAAQRVGPQGRVVAFEPSPATAAWLRRSVASAGYRHVSIVQKAVSAQAGSGTLAVEAQSELNRLVDATARGEPVTLTTLDTAAQLFDRNGVDFVKIDAEGHELAVLEGGGELLRHTSPLVLCEVKAGATTDLTAVRLLEEWGYGAFRVLPGLNALVRLARDEPLDPFQLNVFCCKDDRAQRLAERGLLISGRTALQAPTEHAWRQLFSSFDYNGSAPYWRESDVRPHDGWLTYRQALDDYAAARDLERPIAERCGALERGYAQLRGLLERQATSARVLTFARIAADLGRRGEAVTALQWLARRSHIGEAASPPQEPFLVPLGALERSARAPDARQWLTGVVLFGLEQLSSFSSFFTPNESLARLEALRKLRFTLPALERRRSALERRAALGRAAQS